MSHFAPGPIAGHLPCTEKPAPYRIVRFPAPAKPETDTDWRDRAACRNEDPEIFFAVGVGSDAERATAEAKKICGGCGVITECGTFLAHMKATLPGAVEGVWAGTADADRNREARREQKARERVRAAQRKASDQPAKQAAA